MLIYYLSAIFTGNIKGNAPIAEKKNMYSLLKIGQNISRPFIIPK